ncbi:hypothetical protein HanOQP8_Chr08g0295991 [Helianthus annuus]|nr:hypothetical protein HanLR1_Chr08g0288521 [Helianthus annuus]KAJ0723259.1 hypothetical protein HanOQP8_Chr08g0295991 [Helianthus annuus]
MFCILTDCIFILSYIPIRIRLCLARLDSERRRPQYDLIWEDASLLAGKSFYFPGSADVNGNQVDQWNNTTPPLYLWSRPDWTYKHKSIAQQHGHIPRVQTPRQSDQNGPALDLPVGNYDQGASNQTHAQKTRAPVEAQKHEKRQVPAHEQGLTRYGSTNGTPHNRTNTSATQRYAPRLDELNNVRVNNSGRSGLQEMNSARISGVGQHEPPVGSRGVGGYGPPVNGPGSHMGSLGFAPGPDHQYSQHTSSGGWLDD